MWLKTLEKAIKWFLSWNYFSKLPFPRSKVNFHAQLSMTTEPTPPTDDKQMIQLKALENASKWILSWCCLSSCRKLCCNFYQHLHYCHNHMLHKKIISCVALQLNSWNYIFYSSMWYHVLQCFLISKLQAKILKHVISCDKPGHAILSPPGWGQIKSEWVQRCHNG